MATQEKLELNEQTPLTTTEVTLTTETTTEGASQPETAKKQKWWFKKVGFIAFPDNANFN
jgi:hypothetical protein